MVENILETILIFWMLGGGMFALPLAALMIFALKRNAVWLVNIFASSFAALAFFSMYRVSDVIAADAADKIYMMSFQWGAFFTLVIFAAIGITVMAIQRFKASKRLETRE